MNFNVPGLSKEFPKLMTLTLKNDVKTKYATLEGIYELSPNLHNGRPQWKIKEGHHEIISGSNLPNGGYNWYIMQDGSTRKIQSYEFQIEGMPSDTKYKKFQYHDSTSDSHEEEGEEEEKEEEEKEEEKEDTSDWLNATSGDVIIQGT